jgi:hypothetical protein
MPHYSGGAGRSPSQLTLVSACGTPISATGQPASEETPVFRWNQSLTQIL